MYTPIQVRCLAGVVPLGTIFTKPVLRTTESLYGSLLRHEGEEGDRDGRPELTSRD